jgi:pimeloyl-ACP methyl ester carboxylesterase
MSTGNYATVNGHMMYYKGGSSMMQADAIQPRPQGQITTVNEMQMYYEVYGEGSPLVLLHGFTQTGAFWHPYIATFAEHFRLIVPDLRGHGRSTNPTNQFTHRQAALDISALLEQLGIPQFKALGFSSGADCLLHVATQQPSRVEAMVLIGSGPYWPQESHVAARQLTPESEHWDWHALRQQHVHGDEQIRALLNQFHNFKDTYDDVNFNPPYLATITAKTLIVNGDRDHFCPVSLPVEMYTAIPQAYLWIVPNGDHFPFDGRAKLFTDTVLEFLRGQWQ